MKPKLNKSVYNDYLNVVGESYLRKDDQTFNADEIKEKQKLKQSFDENILPALEDRINDITTDLRICFAIAEGKSIEEINQFQVDS